MADRRAVLLVSHGSRQPYAAAFAREVADALRHDDPGRAVAVSFLERNRPSPDHALGRLVRGGHDPIQVVPLLLSAGHHYRVDLPATLGSVPALTPGLRIGTAPPLLSDSGAEVIRALDDRLGQTAMGGDEPLGEPDGLILLAAGSSDPSARSRVGELAQEWGGNHDLPTEVAFCDLRGDDVRMAVAALHARGARQIACGSLFLAAGRLLDAGRRVAFEAGVQAVAGPLGTTPAMLELIRRRCYEPATAR